MGTNDCVGSHFLHNIISLFLDYNYDIRIIQKHGVIKTIFYGHA